MKPPAHDKGVDPMVKWIWLEMRRKGYSQAFLAKKVGTSDTSLRNYFQGRTAPSYATVRSLVKALGYDLFAEVDP